jgi:hypothetical protein
MEKKIRLQGLRKFFRQASMVLIAAAVALLPEGFTYAQAQEQVEAQAAVIMIDEKIDQAMGVFADLELLRLRARPPVKRGAPIKPPFKQEPPDVQKNFCPQCP